MEDEQFKKLCRRCNRELKDYKSKKLGYGPICYKKYIEKQRKVYLFDLIINKSEDKKDV